MGTLADLAVVGVVGYIGYKVLVDGGITLPNTSPNYPNGDTTIITLPDNSTTPLPSNPESTPTPIFDNGTVKVNEFKVVTDETKGETTVESELTVPVNSTTEISAIENQTNKSRILTTQTTKVYDTRIDEDSANPLIQGWNNLQNWWNSLF